MVSSNSHQQTTNVANVEDEDEGDVLFIDFSSLLLLFDSFPQRQANSPNVSRY